MDIMFLKRFFEFFIALFVLLMFSPVLIIVIVVLLFSNKGKVFCFQESPDKGGRIFNIIKLKSMNDKKDECGELLPYEDRITKMGNLIRKYSLDEIPQLLNVIKVGMSIIGSRPLLVESLDRYNNQPKRRHKMKPGLQDGLK